MNPKISIIIPVYKVESYIEKCMQSLLDQTYTNFEALIIDDGSPDQSINLAKNIVGNDKRFIFHQKKNAGLPSARNYGLDRATGCYIAFLDSDDYYDPIFLESMLTSILISKSDIAICDINIVDMHGNHLGALKQNIDKYYSKNDIFLCNNTISAFSWNKLYNAGVFKDARYDESVKTYEDAHFTFRILYNRKLVHMTQSLYNYVQRPSSITNSISTTLVNDKLQVIKQYHTFQTIHKDIILHKNYLYFCTIKTAIYEPAVIFARYSQNYNKDLRKTIKDFKDEGYQLNFKKILSIMKLSKRIGISTLIIKISPYLFKALMVISKKI